jgi:hypothetical protein
MSVVSGDVTMGLNATVEKLIRKARAGGADTCAVLTELTRSAVGDWPSIQHAGITVVEDGDVVRSIAATYAEHIGRVLTARRGRRRAPVSGSARAQGSVRGQDAIETSKAQLMKHFGVDPAAALTVLLRLSRECNRSLEDVARLLVGPRPVAEPPSQATATATPDHAGGRPPVWAEGAA